MVKHIALVALVAACGSSSSNRRDAGPVANAVDSARFLADLTTVSAARAPGSPHWPPFWEQGYPSIQLTDTANFRNPHYHCAGGEDALADIDVEFATLIIKATVGATAAALDAK